MSELTDIFESKNSEYYFDEDYLIRTRKKDGKKTRIEGEIFYVLDRDLQPLLRKYQVPTKTSERIEAFKAKALIEELRKVDMGRGNIGGRYYALRKVGEMYSTFFTSKIERIEQKEIKKYEEKKPKKKKASEELDIGLLEDKDIIKLGDDEGPLQIEG